MRRIRVPLCLLLALFSLAGCQGPAPTTQPAAREPSVRPGINAEYEDADAEKWTEKFEGESREVYRERDKIVAAAGVRPGQAVADIGAGTGLFTMLLARAVGKTGKVVAVDITPEFVQHIARRAREEGLENVQTVVCKDDSVELPPNSIDVAFICDTYHHFEYPRQTMASIHRALRPGGIVVVVDFERIEGVSRPWVLEHVRASKEIVMAEIAAAGFELILYGGRADFLKENYVLRFKKRG